MSLLYCCIACDGRILCQHQNGFLRCIDFARDCLKQIGSDKQDSETAFTNENCVVHVLIRDGLIYLAVTECEALRDRAVVFLRRVYTNFSADSALLNRAAYSQENELQYDYGRTLAKEMDGFSRIQTNSKMGHLQDQVEEVRGVMTQNIQAMMERGERLEDIVDRAEELHGASTAFSHTARKVKKKMWWENFRMKMILAAVVTVIVIAIVIFILWQTGVFNGGGSPPLPPQPSTTPLAMTTAHVTTRNPPATAPVSTNAPITTTSAPQGNTTSYQA